MTRRVEVMREATRLTITLQVGLAGFVTAFTLLGWISLVRPIASAFEAGDSARGWVYISSWLVWTFIATVLCLGSLWRWRWAFWADLAFLVFIVIASVRGPVTSVGALAWDIVIGLIAVGLLCAWIIGLVRFGPWAMKRIQSQ